MEIQIIILQKFEKFLNQSSLYNYAYILFNQLIKNRKECVLRLELYGCLSSDHLISYTIPQGDRRSFEMDFSDKTYDGYVSSLLTNGLGQLIDGDTGSR